MEYKKLEEVTTIRQGRHYFPIDEGKEYLVIKSGNMVKDHYTLCPPISPIVISPDKKVYTLRPYDVLVCHAGADIGKVSLFHEMPEGEYICNQTISILRPFGIYPVYLYAYLSTYLLKMYWSRRSYKYINRQNLCSLPILIPPEEIQDKITRMVSSYAVLQKKSMRMKEDLDNYILNMVQKQGEKNECS